MTGNLKPFISESFEESFVYNCLVLIGKAYKFIKENAGISMDWEEENISATIFDYIDKSENAITWNINISDEHRLYYSAILTGKKPAKTAARIDFRLTTNWIEQKKRLEYFVEAKNLIESDSHKTGRKTRINACKLHVRYVETGIDNFVSGKYPQKGCLVGYVLQGEPTVIVEKINDCLHNKNRTTERLQVMDSTIQDLEYCYQSTHGNGIIIEHFLLKF